MGYHRQMGRLLTSAIALVAMTLAGPSMARELTAQEAYDAGLTAMLAGDFRHGCPYLEQSVAAEPLPGAQFTLAECYAKWGKHASAIAAYQRYLEMYVSLPVDKRDKQKGRQRIASDQVAALGAIVPRITLVSTSAPSGSTFALDGRPVPADEPTPVDPGTHIATLTTPDGAVQSKNVEAATGDALTITLGAEQPPLVDEPPREPPEPGSNPWPIVGWTAIGLGGGALVGGAITGGLALNEKGTVDDNCIEARCNLTGLDAASKAQSLAQISNVLFIAGGLVATAGILVVVLDPGGDDDGTARLDALVGPTGGTLRVSW